MLSIVAWKWAPSPGYRSVFGPETVNTWRAMVDRHFDRPHRCICVTDDPTGIDSDIEIVPAWNDFADVPSPHGGNNPSCYRRLRMFHPDIAEAFGQRFVSMDLDAVIVGDLAPLFDRTEDFIAWGETDSRSFYNGSLILMSAGARPQVWERFNPETSPREALLAGRFGSDQGHISHVLGCGEATWTAADGVISFRKHVQHNGSRLPSHARIVFFHGPGDPWMPELQAAHPWIAEHYTADRSPLAC